MFRREPVVLKVVLEELLPQLSLAPQLTYARILRIWKDIVPSPLNRWARPVKIEDDHLIVAVSSPVWRMELELRKEQMLKQLNQRLEPYTLKAMVFRLTTLPVHGEK